MPEPYFSTDLLGNNPNYQWLFDNSRPVYAEYAQPQYSMEIVDMSNNSPATQPQKRTNWSQIGNYLKGGMDLATAALQDITDILGNTKSQINDKPSYDFSQTNTFDDLSHNNLHLASTNQLTRPTVGSSFMDINMRTARGALAGATTGNPWVILGGAIGGTLSGVGNSIAKATTYNRDINRLNRLNNQAIDNYHNDFTKAFHDINNKQINMTNLQRSRNMFAEGGNINTTIQTGGTHEENPFGGVQLGVDAQGTPNLAEEGEVVYNDYVFSKRVKPNKNILQQFNTLMKKDFQSYADIASHLLNLHKEDPDGAYYRRTLDKQMDNLAQAQEYQKLAEVAQQYNMTPEEYLQMMQQTQAQQMLTQQNNESQYDETPSVAPETNETLNENMFRAGGLLNVIRGNVYATGGPVDPPKTPNYNIGRTILNANIPQTLTPEDFQKARKDWENWLKTDEGQDYIHQRSRIYGEQPLESFDLATLLTPFGDIEDIAYIVNDIKNRDWKSVAQGTMLAAIPGAWASRGYRNANKIAHQASNSKHLYNQSGRNATDQFHRTPAGSSSAVQRGAREQQVNDFSYTLGNPATGAPPHYIYHRGPETPTRRTITNMDEEVAAVNRQLNQKPSTSKVTTNSATPKSTTNANEREAKNKLKAVWAKLTPKQQKVVGGFLGLAGTGALVAGANKIYNTYTDAQNLNSDISNTLDEKQLSEDKKKILEGMRTQLTLNSDQRDSTMNMNILYAAQANPDLVSYLEQDLQDELAAIQLNYADDDALNINENDSNNNSKPVTSTNTPTKKFTATDIKQMRQAVTTIQPTLDQKTNVFTGDGYWLPGENENNGRWLSYDELSNYPENQYVVVNRNTQGNGYDGIIDETKNAGWLKLLNDIPQDKLNEIKQQIAKDFNLSLAQVDKNLNDNKFGPIHKALYRLTAANNNATEPTNAPLLNTLNSTDDNLTPSSPINSTSTDNVPQVNNSNDNFNNNIPQNTFFNSFNPLRLAPVFDNARSLIEQNNPDYTYSNQLAALYQPLDYNPTGERMRYTPVDQYYLANKAEIARNTQMGAYRNNANTNQSNAYMNSMANQQYNNLISDNYIKALQQNEQMRNQALQYNNQLDAQNEANRLNVQAQNASNYAQIMGNSYQAAEEERLAVENAREANRQNMAANLGLIGKEQSDYYNVNHNPALMYGAFGTFYKGLTPEQQKSFDSIWNNTFNK